MEAVLKLNSAFFAPRGETEPCGMFTEGHLCLFAVFAGAACAALFFSCRAGKDEIVRAAGIAAPVLSCFEAVKLLYNFIYGYSWLDAWLPLSFCSLFLYSLWFSRWGRGRIKKAADSFIAVGCASGGLAFLLFPTTSLTELPALHYLSLYSMLYHSCMLVFGILYIKTGAARVNGKSLKHCVALVGAAAVIAVSLNTVFSSNLMLLREPYGLPVIMLRELYEKAPALYTVFAFLCYIVIPYTVSLGIQKLICRKRKNTDFCKRLKYFLQLHKKSF